MESQFIESHDGNRWENDSQDCSFTQFLFCSLIVVNESKIVQLDTTTDICQFA